MQLILRVALAISLVILFYCWHSQSGNENMTEKDKENILLLSKWVDLEISSRRKRRKRRKKKG